jgi:molecular chaperone DnaJ
LEQKIDLVTAALGARLEIPTVTGETQIIEVPAGAQYGKSIRVPGLGFPVPGFSNSRGDLIVSLQVTTPRDLTERQIELLTEFEKIEEEKKAESPIKGWTRRMGRKIKKALQ